MANLTRIGKILKAHGVRGTLKVMPLTDDKTRYDYLEQVYIQTKHGVKTFDVLAVRYQEKFVLLDLVGIDSMNEAEKYTDNFLAIDKEDRMPLSDNSYYIDDLIGLSVYEKESYLGKIKEVLQPGANDVYIVQAEDGKEILLPAIKSVIQNVDIENQRMEVCLLKGLVD